jgi:hypothetical protein
MTRLQMTRKRIAELEKRYASLGSQKAVLENAWSESVKAAIPELQNAMDTVLIALREAEAEEHRLTW